MDVVLYFDIILPGSAFLLRDSAGTPIKSGSFWTQDEAIAVLSLNRLTREQLVSIREYVSNSLIGQVLPDIEEHVSVVFFNLTLQETSPSLVVVAIPVVVEGILDDASVVPKGQRAEVVYDAHQVVLTADVLSLQEVVVMNVVRQVQVVQRKLHQSLLLPHSTADLLEPLELDGQDRRRPEDVELFLVIVVVPAARTVAWLVQSLDVVELLEAFLQ